MKKKITIIGSGFSALAASCYLAKSGHQVEVFEKNATIDIGDKVSIASNSQTVNVGMQGKLITLNDFLQNK